VSDMAVFSLMVLLARDRTASIFVITAGIQICSRDVIIRPSLQLSSDGTEQDVGGKILGVGFISEV
jgi:hypothetical protein